MDKKMPGNMKYTQRKNVKIWLPNAVPIGHDKYYASPGDLILYKEYYEGGMYGLRLARVIGRIKECDNQGEDCKGYILVSAIDETLNFSYERWIKPEDVSRCVSVERAKEFISFFLSADVNEIHRRDRENWS